MYTNNFYVYIYACIYTYITCIAYSCTYMYTYKCTNVYEIIFECPNPSTEMSQIFTYIYLLIIKFKSSNYDYLNI